MKQSILSHIAAECPWRDTLHWYESLDSTNTKAKELAGSGAPHGTVVLAGHQTAGRGRLGRSFCSEAGMGVYLSVILRPACRPEQLMHLTCAAAAAACRAVENAAGIRPGIKWINDLIVDRKKLGGILTELSVDPASGTVSHAIVGIGVNCAQNKEDFPASLQQIATSFKMAIGKDIPPSIMAAAMIEELARMDRQLFSQKEQLMAAYRKNCITLGQQIMLSRADTVRYAKAIDLDENGSLLVAFHDGSTEWIRSGEAGIRGMYGYV